MSNKKPKPKHLPKQEHPEPDEPGNTYVIGKVRIPELVSQTIVGVMTANDLKYLWDITPRFRLIQYREEEYIDDEDYED